ncbi:prepilin peptidase [Candidatus Poriferisodalis sp.]|uniref:prepilin peptidase n=1 Tax=Candidatus Poriferisodalis sp. TaxID=3101277 RepID=UPI003B5B5E24
MSAGIGIWAATGAWSLLAAHATWTDLRSAIISRRACWAAGIAIASLLGCSAIALGEPSRCTRILASTAAIAAVTEIAYRIRPDAIGYGDIRLIIVNSLLLSWWGPAWPWWALAAGAVAAWPRAFMVTLRKGRGATVRCAPALALGTALTLGTRLATVGPIP